MTRTCERCGVDTSHDAGRCTNGRCGACHAAACTPGGDTSPGHGRGACHTARYVVRDLGPGITRPIRERWAVVDTAASRILDEYASKRAAAADCRERNREAR